MAENCKRFVKGPNCGVISRLQKAPAERRQKLLSVLFKQQKCLAVMKVRKVRVVIKRGIIPAVD